MSLAEVLELIEEVNTQQQQWVEQGLDYIDQIVEGINDPWLETWDDYFTSYLGVNMPLTLINKGYYIQAFQGEYAGVYLMKDCLEIEDLTYKAPEEVEEIFYLYDTGIIESIFS